MADEILPEGNGDSNTVLKLNFAKKPKEPVKEEEQEAPPEDEEPKDNDGDPYDWIWEVASLREVFDFFSKYFEVVGFGDVKLTESDASAVSYLFRLCEKRTRLIQP